MQCQLIRYIVSIVFVLIDAIGSVNHIDRIDIIELIDHINRIDFIDPGVLNYSVMQLKDNSNDPTNSGMNFWG